MAYLVLYPTFCTPAISVLIQVLRHILCCKAFSSQVHFIRKNFPSAPTHTHRHPPWDRLPFLKGSNINHVSFLCGICITYLCTYLNVFLLHNTISSMRIGAMSVFACTVFLVLTQCLPQNDIQIFVYTLQ